jgi:diguanylate cyclase (GGDEF)-like protein
MPDPREGGETSEDAGRSEESSNDKRQTTNDKCEEPHAVVDDDDQLEGAKAIIRTLKEELEMTKKQIEMLWEKNKELEELSITDELTGLYNQRHFRNRLEHEVVRNKRQKHPLCLLFFDVDGLKAYNDTYGHLGGNDVLKAISQSIRTNVDSGYRYGGDEFAVILPEVHAEQAVEIARRINTSLRRIGSQHEAFFQHVSLSFGVAELRAEMDSRTLFRHADDAMYMAKKGRRVESDAGTDKIYVYGSDDAS